MVLDIIALGFIVAFFIRGYMKGFIVAVFSVVAILLGILCALKLSQSFAAWLLEKGYVTSGWVSVVSYLLLFIGVVLLVRLVARLIDKAAEGLMLGTVNRLIGGLLYAFLGAVLWSSLLWLITKLHIVSKETVAESVSAAKLSLLAPWFFEQAGHLIPFVKDTFFKLDHYFDTINSKPA
jgi:membrane protein required for colicin V production